MNGPGLQGIVLLKLHSDTSCGISLSLHTVLLKVYFDYFVSSSDESDVILVFVVATVKS